MDLVRSCLPPCFQRLACNDSIPRLAEGFSAVNAKTEENALATESVVAFHNSQGLEAQGTLIHLSRNSAVFEVYNPYSIVQMSEVLNNLRIRRGERTIYTGRAVVTNLVSTGLMLIVSASLVDPWSDLADLAPGPQLREEVHGFIRDWSASNERLRPDYQVSVSNFRNFLEELSRWLEHGETVAGIGEPGTPPEVVKEFAQDVGQSVEQKVYSLFDDFVTAAGNVSEGELMYHKAFARREIHPLMMCSPFMHRTFTKPLGYAGDYEMVNMILRDPWEGQNTYAKVINAVLLRTDVAQAHRNRIEMLTEHLIAEARRVSGLGQKLRVLNVGCGPASEVCRFIERNALSDRVEFELVDFNQATLDYAEEKINQAIADHRRRTSVKFTHRSVHELLKQAARKKPVGEPNYDYVYCAGLFDYLGDRICGRLINFFYSQARPSGLVVVTNVHPANPSRGIMEHLQEWYLLLRDDNQMLQLAPQLGRQTVRSEATGVNVFLEIRKEAD